MPLFESLFNDGNFSFGLVAVDRDGLCHSTHKIAWLDRRLARLCDNYKLEPAEGLESSRFPLQKGCSPSELCWQTACPTGATYGCNRRGRPGGSRRAIPLQGRPASPGAGWRN